MATSFAPRPSPKVGGLPYLPGLDGMRALAVVAVMIYHANHEWLSGGFLGVEVFFVISGYLITLLLIGEHERNGRVDMRQFWKRRFRRLLPALFVMMSLLAVYMAAFRRKPMGRTRGDFLGGIFYSSNWYQIFVGQGYTAGEAFVPLRHLWSLAVEEQFYLVWPIVMVLVLARRGGSDLRRVAMWFAAASVLVAAAMAWLFYNGDVAAACTATQRQGYFTLFGRCISINESLYLGTLSRAGGLLIGAAFALAWRPSRTPRTGLRDKAVVLDGVGVLGIVALAWLMWTLWLSEGGRRFGIRFDAGLFRGGFLWTGIATVAVIAAVTHQRSALGRVLGIPLLNWIGTRSYGLYLYHWPIYQILRGEAGRTLTITQFIVAMILTIPITEASYRFIEVPVRQGRLGEIFGDQRGPRPVEVYARRRKIVIGSLVATALVVLAAVSIAGAPNRCVGQVECDIANASAITDPAPPTNTNPPPSDGAVTVAQSTIPTTTVAPTTSTTLPKDQRPPLAIGESVMLGAKKQLEAYGFVVDAAESRQGADMAKVVTQLHDSGRLGNLVVVQIGTNGDVTDEEFAAIMANLTPDEVKSVWFLTVRASGQAWIPTNNAKIIGLPAKYPNVQIGYWGDIAPTIAGLSNDGFHLKTDAAKQAYADYIAVWTGVPPVG